MSRAWYQTNSKMMFIWCNGVMPLATRVSAILVKSSQVFGTCRPLSAKIFLL